MLANQRAGISLNLNVRGMAPSATVAINDCANALRKQARLDRLDSERREQHDNYKRAYGACMTARNYTVQ